MNRTAHRIARVVIAAALGSGAASAGNFEPPLPGSYALPTILRVDDHLLLAPDGQLVPMLGLAPGEVALVSFVYLSCGEACPMATATLQALDLLLAKDRALADRVQLVTVSFDPVRDTPEALGRLEASLHPKGRWRFLTSSAPAEIAPVLADFGQDAVWIPAQEGHPPARLRHVLKLFLVDADGNVRNIYSTGMMDTRLVLGDLKTVLGGHASAPKANWPVAERSR